MAKDSVGIEFVKGHPVGPRRAVAWLVSGWEKIDGKAVFESLNDDKRMYVNDSLGMWLRNQINDRRHHGWNEERYRRCHVFKWNDPVRNRLYGFKCHPGIPDSRFEICVLAAHTTKTEQEADPWYKSLMVELVGDEKIQSAIRKQVEEYINKERKS